jgi:hypothetical protein
MTASPEVWRIVYAWISFYLFWMVVVGVLSYNGTIGIGWFLKYFS